ncbi:MAG TPA: 30S ribosomal protein S17 [Alphaproteobacteria bacterium]|nr:30S ribosomal protein S17 [Alphaproteobacteria bacterium]
MENKIKNIGIEAPKPTKAPKSVDPKDPFYGSIKLRGRVFTGVVTSAKMQKTVTVEWPRKRFNKKYERFEMRRSKVKAHNPESIDAKEGDTVRIAETRPLSKTKNFVVIEIVKNKSE